jgi:amino acid transporter
MSFNLQTVQDSIYALITVAAIAVVFALAIVGASGLVQRDKARNRKAAAATVTPATITASDITTSAAFHHPTEIDRVRELVSTR